MKLNFILILTILLMVFGIWLQLDEITPKDNYNNHVKLITLSYAYAVRSLCLDHKEYFFVNAQSSVVFPNNESGVVKNCNY